jgi:glutathione S-transferase
LIELYDMPVSGNCYKVRLLFAHLGVAYRRHSVELGDRFERTELLGALNPALRVPTVVLQDGRSLAESGAILWYFGEGTRFVPVDRYLRAQMPQWMFFEQYEHELTIAVARKRLSYSDPPQVDGRLAELQAAGRKALATLDAHLEGRDYLVGDGMTLADIALYAYTHMADEGFDLSGYWNIGRWLEWIAAEPGHVPTTA